MLRLMRNIRQIVDAVKSILLAAGLYFVFAGSVHAADCGVTIQAASQRAMQRDIDRIDAHQRGLKNAIESQRTCIENIGILTSRTIPALDFGAILGKIIDTAITKACDVVNKEVASYNRKIDSFFDPVNKISDAVGAINTLPDRVGGAIGSVGAAVRPVTPVAPKRGPEPIGGFSTVYCKLSGTC